MMKAFCTCLATALMAGCISAASPLATVDWVAGQIAQAIKKPNAPSPAETVAAKPQEFSRTYTSTLNASDGNTYDVAVQLESCRRLALIVTSSTLDGVTNGTIYAWNGESGQFETRHSTVMPVIVARTDDVATTTTNLAGTVQVTTNKVTRYSAATSIGDYRGSGWYGRHCLFSTNGTRIVFAVSSVGERQYAAAKIPDAATAPRGRALFAAWADGIDNGASHHAGMLQITTITITRKGRDEPYTFNWCLTCDSGVGTGTVAEHALAAFEDWYARPKAGIYQSAKSELVERLVDYAAWGLERDESAKLDLGADQLAIRYKDLYGCSAFKDALTAAQDYLAAEWVRIFLDLYNRLKQHACPALGPNETQWSADMNCCCRHVYPDLTTGESIKCEMHQSPQHKWGLYALVDGHLMMSRDVGCQLCVRCIQADPDKGAIHVEVPETADYCGCFCGYYYEKKVEAEEPPEQDPAQPVDPVLPPPAEDEEMEEETPADDVITDCETEILVPTDKREEVEVEVVNPETGDKERITVPVTVPSHTVATNMVPFGSALGFKHVTKRVRTAYGETITIVTAANNRMDSAPKKMHAKPQNPMQCKCKCGREHWFKASPCPKICRGCGFAEEAFFAGEFVAEKCGHNRNVRGYHTQFDEGYWDAEQYVAILPDGTEEVHSWSNADGSVDRISPYATWRADVLSNGEKKCGCACGRFFSAADGDHGRPAKDADGNEVDAGHHGDFHIYSMRNISEIECPFTRHYCESKGISKVPYCTCNNWEWEVSNTHQAGDFGSGWTGHQNAHAGESPIEKNSGSLACEDTCRFHWPYSHRGEHGALILDHKSHSGAITRTDFPDDEIARAYEDWREKDVCGCKCLAVQRASCDDGDGSLGWTFPVSFKDLSANYHIYDFAESCICKCGTYHYAVTPESYELLYPGLSGLVAWSDCSRLGGVCQLCGYTSKSWPVADIVRAPIDQHVPGSQCACACANAGEKFFSDGNTPRRGWSAAQDGDKYPNNTLRGSAGFTSIETAEQWHRGTKHGCLCSCGDGLEHQLYHKHQPSACKSVCGAKPFGSICEHAPDYYEYKPATRSYTEIMGEHTRAGDADYCGCDCGQIITKQGSSGEIASWHVAPHGSCYCFGKFAPGSPHNHGDAKLVHHLNLAATGKTITNSYGCASCAATYTATRHEYKCDNGHLVYGKESGNKTCGHTGVCPRGCGKCDITNKSCTCPWCNLVAGAVDYCTCEGVSAPNENILKITAPLIYEGLWPELVRNVITAGIETVDGDDPVFEIGANAFDGAFDGWTNLVTVKMNYVTNIGDNAFRLSFRRCTRLKELQFARVKRVGFSAFDGAFQNIGRGKLRLSFPALTDIAEGAFISMDGVGHISLPKYTGRDNSSEYDGKMLFYDCSGLKSVYLPKLERVMDEMFADCISLEVLELPEATDMGVRAFNSSGVKTVYLPKMRYIEYGAFSYCVDLTTLIVPAVTEINSDCFGMCNKLKALDLPSMSINDYDCQSNPASFPAGCKVSFKDGEWLF
jgi:hypothetical protein